MKTHQALCATALLFCTAAGATGIPVYDSTAPYSFASQHPLLAGLVLLALVLIALWGVRKIYPQRKQKPKLSIGVVAVYTSVSVLAIWVMFKPEPSPVMKLMEQLQTIQPNSTSERLDN